MEKQARFRHELKYTISFSDYLALRARLRPVMQLDKHTGADGRYLIRSIYFDNFRDKALTEKIDGHAKREKFRIRYYNDDLSHIDLEKKTKDGRLCIKSKAGLTQGECRQLLAGNRAWMLHHPQPLVRELYIKMNTQQLRPKVLVSYLREPYVFPAGNVRITFDSSIRTSLFHQGFLEESVTDITAPDEPSTLVLEVKFDDFLPDIIACLLQLDGCRQEAFSKYAACRRFG